MGLIECTSGASLWRGYDYYKGNKVKNLHKINDTQYAADVVGTMNEPYKVLHIQERQNATVLMQTENALCVSI